MLSFLFSLTVVKDLILAQLETQFSKPLPTLTEAASQLAEDTERPQSDPALAATFIEHTALLNQAVEEADLIIDGFDS